MGKFVDLTGQRFGRLTVLDRVGSAGGGSATWRCLCDCGKETIVLSSSLRRGATRSCGCLSAEKTVERCYKHGGTNTRLYRIWSGMIERCHNPNHKGYKNYGARGIAVCDAWKSSFAAFQEWALSNGYSEDLTIDRKDNDKPYCPENCRWLTLSAQQHHKRDNHLITYNGETHNIAEWVKITGIKRGTIEKRLRLGWPPDKAVSTPPRR